MAASKRPHDETEIVTPLGKRQCTDKEDQDLGAFLKWCKAGNLQLSEKVRVGREGSCAQYGMVAVDDIEEGECLFEIPRSMLLTQDNCRISQLLKDEAGSLQSPSGWLPLLVALMYEYTNPDSRWRPYYSLVPDFNEVDLPMCWPSEEVSRELKGTGLPEAVQRDLRGLEKEFKEQVLPFVLQHPDKFTDPQCQDLDFFKKMVAFIMAYSFTEPYQSQDEDSDDEQEEDVKKPPIMVPMADILNHVAKNNAHLNFGKESLEMVAVRSIKKGDEVFNTYGELPNWQLLQVYGFAEHFPLNYFDSVDIPMKKSFEWITHGKNAAELTFMTEKWNFLKDLDVVQEDGMFVVGVFGVLTEEEMFTMLKVMSMDSGQFVDYKEKEGWSEVEDGNDSEDVLALDDIKGKPKAWREFLKRIAEGQLAEYPETLDKIEQQLQGVNFSKFSRRKQYSLVIKHGQMKLLTALLEVC